MKKHVKILIIIVGIILMAIIALVLWNAISSHREGCRTDRSRTRLATPPFTFKEEDKALNSEDFFYSNTAHNFTIGLGMNKEEAFSLMRRHNPRIDVSRTKEREVICGVTTRIYIHRLETFIFENELLTFIGSESDNDINLNWSIYGGIDSNTSREEIIEILGEPTIYQGTRSMTYIFFKTEDGNYQKLRNREEARWFARKSRVTQLKYIDFAGGDSHRFIGVELSSLTANDHVDGTLQRLLQGSTDY